MVAETKNTDTKRHDVKFREDGFVIAPPVVEKDLIRRADAAIDAVMAGRYETGIAPLDWWWQTGDDPDRKLRKIDQPHLANRAIYELISHPAIGAWAAAVTGAQMVQVWCVQLLNKPGNRDPQNSVGWHQDCQYWGNWWTPESHLYTLWVAVSDVTENSGPLCFIRGSHRWGLSDEGNFFAAADDFTPEQFDIPDGEKWEEIPAVMPAGAFSLHHCLTLHGSYPNRSPAHRRSFAIHIRTEASTPTPGRQEGYDYVSFLDDPEVCPVMYER